jgi:hypothetical protein
MAKNNTQGAIINTSFSSAITAISKDAFSAIFKSKKKQWSKVMALSWDYRVSAPTPSGQGRS